MSDQSNLPPIDFPFRRGPVRGCDLCVKNVPTERTSTFKDESGEWITVCEDCQKKGS